MTDASPSPTNFPSPQDTAVVEEGILCIGCDYNLVTLSVGGRCPECGTSIDASIAAHSHFGFASNRLRYRARRLLFWAAFLSGIACVDLLVLPLRKLTESSINMQTAPFSAWVAFLYFWGDSFAVCVAMALIGAIIWFICRIGDSRKESARVTRLIDSRSPTLLTVFASMWAVSVLLNYVPWYWSKAFSGVFGKTISGLCYWAAMWGESIGQPMTIALITVISGVLLKRLSDYNTLRRPLRGILVFVWSMAAPLFLITCASVVLAVLDLSILYRARGVFATHIRIPV